MAIRNLTRTTCSLRLYQRRGIRLDGRLLAILQPPGHCQGEGTFTQSRQPFYILLIPASLLAIQAWSKRIRSSDIKQYPILEVDNLSADDAESFGLSDSDDEDVSYVAPAPGNTASWQYAS